jgi:hypothetical protein
VTEHTNNDVPSALATPKAMVPVLIAAEQTQAARRRKFGKGYYIANYLVSAYEISLNRFLADLLNPRGSWAIVFYCSF